MEGGMLKWEGVGIEGEMGRRNGKGKEGMVKEEWVRMEGRVWRWKG